MMKSTDMMKCVMCRIKIGRNRLEIMHGSVSAWSCHVCLPKSCCKLSGAISLGDAWSISRIRLPEQSVLAFLIQSLRTMPNVSVYGPDYLFQTVIGGWGGHPTRSRLSKNLQDGLLTRALGNDSMLG